MARLRIRIELSRGGVGVPLNKLASVVEQAQKFFHMLAEDVHVDPGKGEWLGFDFDNESLNFTAEYVGPVTAGQVHAFYAAFDGTTPLRRTTIAQFARITEAIGEEELIGFGLYPSESEPEPSEWRCLSRRDALRIAEEIQLLIGAESQGAGSQSEDSRLPAVSDPAGARLFGRGQRPADSNVSERLARVEQKVEQHSTALRDLKTDSAAAEQSFRNLLSAVETFCDQATQQIERVSPAALPPAPSKGRFRWALIPAAAILTAGIILIGFIFLPAHPPERVQAKTVPAAPLAALPPAAPVPPPPAPHSAPMKIELAASEPTWISLTDADGNKLMTRLLSPGDKRTLELENPATLRTGNAGGLLVSLDGKALGTIGPRGKVREIKFSGGAFKIVAPE